MPNVFVGGNWETSAGVLGVPQDLQVLVAKHEGSPSTTEGYEERSSMH